MAYDFQLDLRTGDWVFNSVRDYAGASGEAIIQQRIHARLLIERGSFIFDLSGTLGSNLRQVLRSQATEAKSNAEVFVKEALAPMSDIIINDVIVENSNDDPTLDASEIKITVVWSHDNFSDFSTSNQITNSQLTVINFAA